MSKTPIRIRKSQPATDLSEKNFKLRANKLYQAHEFDEVRSETEAVIDVKWKLYDDSKKSPISKKAGAQFKHPEVEVAVDWLKTREAIKRAKIVHDHPGAKPHFLIINGSPRSEHTCPGETSKTHRMAESVITHFKKKNISHDYLDLSRINAEYGIQIHPCKACVSTAMPLCHWPCSCYPNHALGQIHDWMNEIYPMWTRAHGVMILTPVHWYSPTSVFKLMMDRLVCADGGNPDYTSTKGKTVSLAKEMEMKGWDFPKHLGGRLFSVVTHGDSEGAGHVKTSIENWLLDMGLISAGNEACIDRYVGYYKPYAQSHDDYDLDKDLHREVAKAASLLVEEVKKIMGKPRNEAVYQQAVRRK